MVKRIDGEKGSSRSGGVMREKRYTHTYTHTYKQWSLVFLYYREDEMAGVYMHGMETHGTLI